MRILFALAFALFLFACTARKDENILNPSQLQSHFIHVRADRDTVVRTPKGAVLTIAAGTFQQDLDLEVKEAYSMPDIVLAGLVTESNGSSLRSGGMLYLQTKEGKDAVLQKPIGVQIPTASVEEGMALYRGEIKNEGINWVQSDTVQPSVSAMVLQEGKALYLANCATCHGIQKQFTGPALAGVQRRGPWSDSGKLVQWVHNPGRFIPTTSYTRNLVASYNGQIMPSFPQLSPDALNSILAFVNNEASKLITDTFQRPFITANDTTVVASDTFKFSSPNDTLPENPQSLLSLRNGFTDVLEGSGFYRFEIRTLGWFNVDQGVAGLPGTTLCEVNVKLKGAVHPADLYVYAFFPAHRNLSVGYPSAEGRFSFDKLDGKIPLYLGEKGVVIAFGRGEKGFYFGKTAFVVKPAQELSLTLEVVTEKEMINLLKEESREDLQIGMKKDE
jgi:mono/diheme cytochrome c family protein